MEIEKKNIVGKTMSKKISLKFLILIIIAVSFFSSAVGFFAAKISFDKFLFSKQKKEDNLVVTQRIIDEDSAVIGVAEKSSPAIVSIVITKDVPKYKDLFNDPFSGFGFFFNPFGYDGQGETEKRQVGGGSGFFVSSDGMIITNKHVVSDAQAEYSVIDNNGKEYPAKVLARHPVLDVAIIDIEGDDFPVINLGNSDELKVGQTVIAIGNSLGEFSNSVSKGIISGLKRNITAGSGMGELEELSGILQTDAAINPGNSGGPLLDVSGRVIGVNVAMAQGAENVGFALPINQVTNFIDQIKKDGKMTMPFLGVRYVAISREIAKANSLPFEYGVLIIRGEKISDLAVIPGSPADKAGIVENDIILEIDGKKLEKNTQLGNIIAEHKVDDEISLKIWHKGEEKNIKVKLEERKQ